MLFLRKYNIQVGSNPIQSLIRNVKNNVIFALIIINKVTYLTLHLIRSSSIQSCSSTAVGPIVISHLSLDESKQLSIDMQTKASSLSRSSGANRLPLWSTGDALTGFHEGLDDGSSSSSCGLGGPESKKMFAFPLDKRDDYDKKSDKSMKPSNNKKGGRYDNDDDDIVITKESVKMITRPNGLERNVRFSNFYKFSQEWMNNLRDSTRMKSSLFDQRKLEVELIMKKCKERRRAAPTVEETVSQRFKLLDMRHPSARIEISEEDVLVELTPEMEGVITNALRKHPPNETLTEKFNIQITRRDIATLSGLNWLNDEVVNFYMNLLMERGKNDNYTSVYAFNTFFYPKLIKMGFSGVKRWTKKVTICYYIYIYI